MSLRMLTKPILAAFILCCGSSPLHAQNQSTSSNPLGVYGKQSTYCGNDPAKIDATAIPDFGCFVLTPGHIAKTTIGGHQIEITVSNKGEEVFTADGTVVTDSYDAKRQPPTFTNLPFVHTMGVAGYRFCTNSDNTSCPTEIMVFARREDKSVLFEVSECPPELDACTTSKEGYDFLIMRKKQGYTIR